MPMLNTHLEDARIEERDINFRTYDGSGATHTGISKAIDNVNLEIVSHVSRDQWSRKLAISNDSPIYRVSQDYQDIFLYTYERSVPSGARLALEMVSVLETVAE